MPGLRLLLRMAPVMVGALAVGVWLRRRRAERKALPAPTRARELVAGEASTALVGEVSEAALGGANVALNAEPADSAAQAPRFQREPIDIVTVVDDLLQAGR